MRMRSQDKMVSVLKLSIIFDDHDELRALQELADELGLDKHYWPMEMLQLFYMSHRQAANDASG